MQGPLINKAAVDKVQRLLSDALSKGAKVQFSSVFSSSFAVRFALCCHSLSLAMFDSHGPFVVRQLRESLTPEFLE